MEGQTNTATPTTDEREYPNPDTQQLEPILRRVENLSTVDQMALLREIRNMNPVAANVDKAAKPEVERTECLCGCGEYAKPKKNYLPGHDQRTKGYVSRASAWFMASDEERKKLKGVPGIGVKIPQVLVDRMREDPTFEVHEYDAETVTMLAEEVGTF